MREPTQRQQEVLTFITGYSEEHGFPPTIREIARYFTISVKGAYDHVSALQRKGYLTYEDGRSRALELLKTDGISPKDFIAIPVLGTVPAGPPSMTEAHWDGYITVHCSAVKKLKKSGEYFALTVRGDSMNGAGILDGDTAIVEKQTVIKNGEIAVVQLDDKVTLKRFYLEHDRIRLQPENPAYPPLYCSQELYILGRLAAVIRSY